MDPTPAPPKPRTFRWDETAARLRAVVATTPLAIDESGRGFVARDGTLRCSPPLVQPIAAGCHDLDGYLQSLPERLGCHLVLLLQAGASALGLWEDGELLRHKVIKKYVVRGKGRAQPTHLKTRGKSRYGSRLRLQNWKRQLEETNEKMREWERELGGPDLLFYSCPVRSWPELWATAPPPPFAREAFVRIPMHVHVPSFDELQRVYRWLCHGRIATSEI